MARWLTQEWLDEQRRLAADQPERPGATARMQYVVKGDRGEDDVAYYWVLDDGKLVESGLGSLDDAQLTLAVTRADAAAILRGELDEQTAYMQGRIKVDGDMSALMALLPITGSAEYKKTQATLLERTEF